MSRRSKTKAKKAKRLTRKTHTQQPQVHVKVAIAGNDFRAATRLIKPAVLYSDRVTIHSPAASLLNAAMSLGTLTNRRQKLDTMLELISKVPSLADELNVSPQVLEQIKVFFSIDPRLLRGLGRMHGADKDIEALLGALDEFDSIWEEQIPKVLDGIRNRFGVGELLDALASGLVAVADLGSISNTDYVAASLRAATGDAYDDDLDQEIAAFVARLVEILTESRSFPLLDADSTDLARSLELESALEVNSRSMRRGTEISSAVSFMGFLPSFEHLGMDEILDLRGELRIPLVRFRGALAKLSKEFEMRPIDEGFDVELEDAWHQRIAPSLLEIRELLAEHGLLKEVASVAMGDPRRLMVEAGGIVATGHGTVHSLPPLMTAGVAVGVPLADTVTRALRNTINARRAVRKNAFFFLHRLKSAAVKRSHSN